MSHYSSGGFSHQLWDDVKITKNKPSKTAQAIFQALESGPMRRKDLVEILKVVNERPQSISDGYMSSTIAWHTNTGRLRRIISKNSNKVFFSLTNEGISYAKERGIL